MPQNYYVSAVFTQSAMGPQKIFTIQQKNTSDPMGKLISAVNVLLAKTTITVTVSGVDSSGEHESIPMDMKITNIPFWLYIQSLDVLIAPFETDKFASGLVMISEANDIKN